MRKLLLLFFALNIITACVSLRFDPFGPYYFDEEESGFVYLSNYRFSTIEADKLLESLKGDIKSIREIEYEVEDGAREKVRDYLQNSLKKFDRDKRLAEIIFYYHNSSIIFKSVYQYDNKGNSFIEENYEDKSNLADETVYEYDKKGRLIKFYTKNAPMSENVLIYDKKNNQIDMLAQGVGEERLITKYVFKYDKKGRLINQSAYLFEGNLVESSKLKTDGSEEEMLKSRYNYKGLPTAKLDYQYNKNGDLIALEYRNYYGIKISISIQYDPKKNWKKEVTYTIDEQGNKEQTSSVVYVYNKTEIPKEVSENSTLITYNYQYDFKGNWIERVEYVDGEVYKVAKREIEYY